MPSLRAERSGRSPGRQTFSGRGASRSPHTVRRRMSRARERRETLSSPTKTFLEVRKGFTHKHATTDTQADKTRVPGGPRHRLTGLTGGRRLRRWLTAWNHFMVAIFVRLHSGGGCGGFQLP